MPGEINSKAERLARAAALREAGDLAGAGRIYRAVAAAEPADPEPHHHLGGLYARLGDLAQAEAHYRRALELAPQAAGTARAFAVLLLSQGRYPEGFALFEARHRLAQYAKPELPFAEWRGEAVAGKRILIWPEQGLGDQIQFARFAPVLKARGAQVTLLCWRPLARLFAASLGVEVIAADGAVEFPDPDGWVMAMSLAERLGVTLETLPSQPYLRAAGPGPELPPGFKVGLVTRGNPVYGNDPNRSLPPAAAAALRGLPAQIIGLTLEETGARDFADTAAIVDQLDLVISVDTAVAHLAGAMGKPCWVLLPAAWQDWRWLRERRDSPWYPSVRLYRQSVPGDWGEVVGEIEADLAALL
ncbi:MAG: putative repeat protein [Phenylobacterium sp.]|nr:putative repeat protein [Phenylobacterium sp.]